MIFRAHLDCSWSDLAFGAIACFVPHRREILEARIRGAFAHPERTLVCLAVRSGFDLLLEAARLPRGSEVLLSAVTVPDMARIVRAHGLVPVPVDLDPDTLAPDPRALHAAWSPRSKMLVVAHLFGGVVELGPSRAFAKAHGLVLVEDCAQSYVPGTYEGDPDSDVCMLSFGPIKTSTALGGAVLLVADDDLRRRMQAVQDGRPVQSRLRYLRRLAKYGGLQLLTRAPAFALFRAACGALGRDFDQVLRDLARGFRGGDLLARLRLRPPTATLALLARRLERPNRRLPRRLEVGRGLAARLGDAFPRPGRGMATHTHWVFPVLSGDPEELQAHLRDSGFDATPGTTSLTAVEPAGERPEVVATRADDLMDRILFVPAYPEMGEEALKRLGNALTTWAATRSAEPSASRAGVVSA